MSRAAEDWVAEMADAAIEAADRRSPGRPVVVASGLSPSGPVHLGNLREVMTPHLVADEIRRRGRACRHLLSWDDYDRFRKVPAGIDPSWEAHIGKPLSDVPAPSGSPFASWAEHFKAPMVAAMERLGIDIEPISQTVAYRAGAYTDSVLLAVRERGRIDAILAPYRTKQAAAADPALEERDEAAAEVAAEDGEVTGSVGWFPFKPYCESCGRDLTHVTAWDDASTTLTYTCDCGHAGAMDLRLAPPGKLVWKVDWPMRWAHEGVIFEPSGVDHQSPGSSFEVGKPIVEQIFGGERPIGPMYAFVGVTGMAKMSSSKGAVPTASDALEVMEPQVLRWLYARRKPRQSFTVGFGADLLRLYDEWDAAVRKVAAGSAAAHDVAAVDRAQATPAGALVATPRLVPYRTETSVIDITAGDDAQLLRILGALDPEGVAGDLSVYEPRLSCARRWVATQMPDDDRTTLRVEPDHEVLDALDDEQRAMVALLLERLDDDWSIDGLTTLVYGVPKVRRGLPIDEKLEGELKAELAKVQRAFFEILYRLLIGRTTGPRLPTLLLAATSPRVRVLLGG